MTFSAGSTLGGSLFGGIGKTTAPTLTFGATTATTTATGFAFGTPTLSTGTAFGQTTKPSIFNTTGTTSLFPGFGSSINNNAITNKGLGTSTIGKATAPVTNAVDPNGLTNILTAISVPTIFGDDRDTSIAKLNKMQAFLGIGKGFYNANAPPIELRMENPFCRFKAVGYSCMPSCPDSAGLVALTINKKEVDVKTHQQQVVEALQSFFGNKPNLVVFVEGLKPLPENKTEVVVYLLERDASGNSRRFPAGEVSNFLNQANVKTQLQTLGVEKVIAKAGLTEEQLNWYLSNPPAGIHPILWEQARKDNPQPSRLVPVPILGFEQLHSRIKFQKQETALHQNALEILSDDITNLQQKHTETMAKLSQYKRRCLDLSHRVLQVISKQEVKRKTGCSIQLDEEELRIQLESNLAALNGPTQFKGRLNELLAQLRLQQQMLGNPTDVRYSMDKSMQANLKQHLEKQQEGLMHLTEVIRSDFEDLKLIQQGLEEYVPRR